MWPVPLNRFGTAHPVANLHLLDNMFWHCLSGPHLHFSAGNQEARRYAQGLSPMIGFPDYEHPNFAALGPFCESGERFYSDRWSGPAPAGWRIEVEATMFKMYWSAAIPDEEDSRDFAALGPEHAEQAMELATLTKPGPFGLRTIELGEYFGYFEGGRLVAMAGERMCAPGLREISGVCTHPDFQGRGLARRLMNKLARRQLLRGETPFLNVMRSNEGAHRLYEKMGFEDYLESVVRVVSPL
ncbi:MAG: GNAT family N-acetyltransferase [Burkholderiaceae bacterium]|nr:GNAT family N-acetyltransferase [Burkholderiaceae bacterium]